MISFLTNELELFFHPTFLNYVFVCVREHLCGWVYMKECTLSGYYHESSLITVPPFLLRQGCSCQAAIIDGSHTYSSFTCCPTLLFNCYEKYNYKKQFGGGIGLFHIKLPGCNPLREVRAEAQERNLNAGTRSRNRRRGLLIDLLTSPC